MSRHRGELSEEPGCEKVLCHGTETRVVDRDHGSALAGIMASHNLPRIGPKLQDTRIVSYL